MIGWIQKWSDWPQALRARYSLLPKRSTGIGMVFVAPRRPALHILRPLTVRLSWNLGPPSEQHYHAAPAAGATAHMPGVREVVRERERVTRLPIPLAAPGAASPGIPQREVVPEAGWPAALAAPTPRFENTFSLIHRRIATEETEQRRRRITLTTEMARVFRQRLHESSVRIDSPLPEPPRMVDAAPNRPAPAGPAITEFETPSRVAKGPSPVKAQPEIDMEAVTSQVIQQLDHRLIAYRERTGRI